MDDTNQNIPGNQPQAPVPNQVPPSTPLAPANLGAQVSTPVFQAPQMPPVQQVSQQVPAQPVLSNQPMQQVASQNQNVLEAPNPFPSVQTQPVSQSQKPTPIQPQTMPQSSSMGIFQSPPFQEPQQPIPQAAPIMQPPLSGEPQASSSNFLQSLYGPSTPEELAQAAGSSSSDSAQAPTGPEDISSSMPSQTLPPQEPLPTSTTEYQASPPPLGNPLPEEEHHTFFPKPLRILLGVLVVFVIVLLGIKLFNSFTGTGNGGKVTITYWGLWEDSTVMQPIIADFEKQNPNITVNYIKEDPKEYNTRLLTRIQQGTGPDIFRYHVTWLPSLMGVLAPLPKDVVSKQELSSYFPFVQRDIVKNGAVYGLPLGIDTLSLFVNKSIFDKAKTDVPTTWDNFITVARALTQKDENGKIKISGAAIGTYDNITHAPDILSLLLVQNGVNLTSMTPSENAADALTFYTSFAQDESNVWDNTLDMSQLAFAKGNVAMYFGYSWDIFLIKAANPSLDFAVYPVPHLPGRNTTIASYWVEGVSNKSKYQKEALAFMKYLAQKDTMTKLYTQEAKTRDFGELYPQKDLADTLKSNYLLAPFISQGNDAQSSFFAGETQDTGINSQMNAYLGNAVRSVLGNTSAQTAVETLNQGVSQVLKQYGQTQ